MTDTDVPKLKEIGRRIREFRNRRGWTIEALAFEAKLSTPQVSEIERGLRDAQITTYIKIADAFGISVAVLFPPNPSDEKTVDEFMEIYEKINDMIPDKKAELLDVFKKITSMVESH